MSNPIPTRATGPVKPAVRAAVFLALVAVLATAVPANAQLSHIQELPGQDPPEALGGGTAIEAANGDIVVAYTENGEFTSFPDGTPGHVYITRSTDGGMTWSERVEFDEGTDVQSIGWPSLFMLGNGNLHLSYWYLPDGPTIRKNFVSEDSGVTWTPLSTSTEIVEPYGVTPNGTIVGLEFVESPTVREVYVTTSTNNGATWTRGAYLMDEDFTVCTPRLFAADNTNWEVFYTECAFGYGGSSPTHRIVTTDAGVNWSEPEEVMTSASGFGTYAHVVHDADGTTLWLIYANGVNISYRTSADGGATWSDPEHWTNGDEDTRDTFPVCTGGANGPNCIFYRVSGGAHHTIHFGVPGVSADPVGVEYVGDVNDTFRLHQNYPNPFSDETTIEFALTEPVDVTLSVYNLLGQEVERLVEARLAAGDHETAWDASQHPAGVYYYRLSAGSGMAIGSMAVVR